MNIDWSAEDIAFREEVRAFLAQSLTDELRKAGSSLTSVYADYRIGMAWQRILNKRGWAAPAWPVEFGGCGWSVSQRYIFATELAAAGAPPTSPMGIGMCGPVLIGHGTKEQQDYFLPRMLNGDDFWCQGYSEPQSGSDLATLQMSAVEDGEDFICTGHKLWTTHAHEANWIFCLVRTAREEIPQKGITFLLIDMTSPGVEVTPIVSLSGEHIQNHVFFTDVRVPRKNAVGPIGQGWTVAKHLMQFERGGGVASPGMKARLAKAARILNAQFPDRSDGEGIALRRQLAEAAVQVEALEAIEFRVMSALSVGSAPGPESSILKTVGTELSQRLTEIALTAAGAYAGVYQPHMVSPGGPTPGFTPPPQKDGVGPEYSWTVAAKYLNDRAGSIYAGTNEIQRNIMAKAVLGL
ncbi:alkylation response protein AidB-like acyl-CoA dehydrogenase [Caulobacter ginsengisoli]|uniref:Alkylation response protein AidB-like acyl-CoA dehydrogenase n=1 Tax=Caulobacter ginsengisoli TaxID=400775 RepID=A0ABU0IVN7_9CAUL|nr:acyl-CoA dehydrogenase family protein [Caulobacter ginsengisoli]MDQ0465002.1 alkylation response protein AidB-like acyl-CoA dehydrogenase [Caulobacter ginsengisoli]